MEEIVRHIEDRLGRGESTFGLLILAAASLLEYIFPPFPGDTVVLLGAFLVAWAGWSPWKVMLVTVAGALAGGWIDTMAGRLLGRRLATMTTIGGAQAPSGSGWLRRLVEGKATREGIEKIMEMYRRWGVAVILLNRFFPGIRAFFFVGAGMAAIPMWKVLLFGGIGAAIWNFVIFFAGYFLGSNWEALLSLFRAYTKGAYTFIGLVAAAVTIFLVVRFLRRRGGRK